MSNLEWYTLVFFQIYVFSLFGLLTLRANYLFAFIAIEVALLAATTLIVVISAVAEDLVNMILVLLLLATAAAESAIGLSLLIRVFKLNKIFATIEFQVLINTNQMKHV